MGINSVWQNNIVVTLKGLGVNVEHIQSDKYELLYCNQKIVINLVPLVNNYKAEELIELQIQYQSENIYLVHLWEDVWKSRPEQVTGRIKSILGQNKRLHGRKAKVIVIDQRQADVFLMENHVQGSAKAKYKLALEIDGQMIAVACFSNSRIMKRISEEYKSFELIRFATIGGYTVTGGFSKLLKHFIEIVNPNDIMSYADRDWSLGNVYKQSGFKLVETIPPAHIWLQKGSLLRYFPHRLPATALQADEFIPVFNTGNLKYILYLK